MRLSLSAHQNSQTETLVRPKPQPDRKATKRTVEWHRQRCATHGAPHCTVTHSVLEVKIPGGTCQRGGEARPSQKVQRSGSSHRGDNRRWLFPQSALSSLNVMCSLLIPHVWWFNLSWVRRKSCVSTVLFSAENEPFHPDFYLKRKQKMLFMAVVHSRGLF